MFEVFFLILHTTNSNDNMNSELFRTPVDIPAATFQIQPAERVLCVGSCFADEIGRRFQDDHFPTVVNPYGVMYNPASILHSIERLQKESNIQHSPLLIEGGVSVGRGGAAPSQRLPR